MAARAGLHHVEERRTDGPGRIRTRDDLLQLGGGFLDIEGHHSTTGPPVGISCPALPAPPLAAAHRSYSRRERFFYYILGV